MNEEIRALADRYAAELKRNIDGRVVDIAVYGQEFNYTTWKMARMNLAIRGIDANLGLRNADSFRANLHSDLKADFILANPPFNMSDWGGENLRQDVRWKFGMPPLNNVSYEWGQYATPCANGREN